MMHALYRQQGASLNISILTKPEAQSFIQAHAATLDGSFRQVPMSDAMRSRLQRSDYIFSGIKTFHELNQAFPSLLDENGNRKPFERFLNDVQSIHETYNRNYLRAEYNFVHASADMAAKWEQFEADGDRYLLQYRTANDDRVRPEHAELEGVTLPIDDPFWAEYYPPNGWNCRCTVVQVRRAKYPVTPHDEAMQRGEAALQRDTRRMFRFNPGQQKKTFPDYNPYTISQCRHCPTAKATTPGVSTPGTTLAFIPQNQLCQACQLLHQCRDRAVFSRYDDKDAFERMRIVTRHKMAESGCIKMESEQLYTGHLKLGKSERWALSKHAWTTDELQALCKISDWLPGIKNGKYLNIDMSRPNWKKKINEGIRHFVAYDVNIDGTDFVFKTAAVAKGTEWNGRIIVEHPYSLKKKKDE